MPWGEAPSDDAAAPRLVVGREVLVGGGWEGDHVPRENAPSPPPDVASGGLKG